MGGKKTKSAKVGAGGKQILAGSASPERFHHCPECPADERGALQRMQAVKNMPGGKMTYTCKSGHIVGRGMTILK